MRKFSRLLLALLIIAGLIVPAVPVAAITYYTKEQTSYNASWGIVGLNNTYQIGQRLSFPVPVYIDALTFYIKRVGSPSGSVQARIQHGTDGANITNNFDISSLVAIGSISTDWSLVTFLMNGNTSISGDVRIVVAQTYVEAGTNYIAVRYAEGLSTTNESFYYGSDAVAAYNATDSCYYQVRYHYVESGTSQAGDLPAVRTPGANVTNNTSVARPTADNVSQITWLTPRLAYNNEIAQVVYNGTAGSQVNMQLLAESGQILASGQDYLRSDGLFKWQLNLPASYTGFLRFKDSVTGATSVWGYVDSAPGAIPIDTVSAMVAASANEVYQKPFSTFARRAADVGKIYYRTTANTSNLSDYRFQIFNQGVNTSASYNQTLEYLRTNYTYASANNVGMQAAGFVLTMFNMPGGYDNKDGLIINLGVAPSSTTYGFYQPVIWRVTGNAEYTTTLSSLWYLPTISESIQLTITKTLYTAPSAAVPTPPTGPVAGHLIVQNNNNAATNLGTYQIYQTSPTLSTTDNASGSLSLVDTAYSPGTYQSQIGSWLLTVKLSSTATSFVYRYDKPFTVAASGDPTIPQTTTKTIAERVNDLVDNWGMNNTMGKWAFMGLTMLAVAALMGLFIWYFDRQFNSPALVAVLTGVLCVIELAIVGAFIFSGFLEIMGVILLVIVGGGIVVGLVFKMFRG